MKRSLKITLVVSIWATMVIAQEPAIVSSVEIVDYGVYRIQLTGERVPMPSAGAGGVRPASRAVLVVKTNQIPATLGTTFGLRFILVGDPVGAVADVDIVVNHPPFKDSTVKATSNSDRVPWHYRIGEKAGYTYTFDHDWEAVPGKWSIEVWQAENMLARENFFVISGGS